VFGFSELSQPHRLELQAWLVPVALATTSGAEVARLLVDEFRRRRIIVPGVSVAERIAATALLEAERHVAGQLTGGLAAEQRRALDELLQLRPGTKLSQIAWARQPPGVAGHRSFAALVQRLEMLRAVGLDPEVAASVHPDRLRRLSQEGVRLSAQHQRPAPAGTSSRRDVAPSWSRPCWRRSSA